MKIAPSAATSVKNSHAVEPDEMPAALGFVSNLGLLCFGALLLLLAGAPCYLSGMPSAAVDILGGDAYVPAMTLMSFSAPVCLLLGLSGQRAPHTRLSVIVAVFFAWCALSALVTVYAHETFLEIARLVGCAAWFFAARTLLSGDENDVAARRIYLLTAIVIGAVIVGGLALWTFFQDRNIRQQATFFNSNLLANYCAMSLPLVLSLGLKSRQRGSARTMIFAGVALLLIFGGLAVTSSKGGLLAALVALFLFAIATFRARGRALLTTLRAHRNIAIVATLIFVIFSGALLGKTVLPRLQAAGGGEQNSTMFRVYTWRGTLQMAQARPLLGWGTGSYASAYPQFAITGFTRTAHQVWLQLAAESGFPAILLLLGICGLGASSAWRALKSDEWPVAAGGVATVSAFVVHGLTDSGWSITSIVLLLLVTLALIDSLHTEKDSLNLAPPISNLNYPWLGAALLLGIFAAVHGRVVGGEDLLSKSRESLKQGLNDSALQQAREATEIDAYSARLWHNRGRIEQALNLDAVPAFRRAMELQPTTSSRYSTLADELGRQSIALDRDKYYDQAVKLYPNDTRTLLARAKYLESLKTSAAQKAATQDYERVARLYDEPYGKYPAIAEAANLDFVRAFLKLGKQAKQANDQAKLRLMIEKSEAVLKVWRDNDTRNRQISQGSGTEDQLGSADEVAELEAQLKTLKENGK